MSHVHTIDSNRIKHINRWFRANLFLFSLTDSTLKTRLPRARALSFALCIYTSYSNFQFKNTSALHEKNVLHIISHTTPAPSSPARCTSFLFSDYNGQKNFIHGRIRTIRNRQRSRWHTNSRRTKNTNAIPMVYAYIYIYMPRNGHICRYMCIYVSSTSLSVWMLCK